MVMARIDNRSFPPDAIGGIASDDLDFSMDCGPGPDMDDDEMRGNRVLFMLSTGIEPPPRDLSELLKQVQSTAQPTNQLGEMGTLPGCGSEPEWRWLIQESAEANARLRENQSQLTADVSKRSQFWNELAKPD